MMPKSNIEKVVFIYYSDSETKKEIPVHQEVEYRSARELWKLLKALPKQYNCRYPIPDLKKVEPFFELFNLMSGDKVSNEDIIASANSIPQFKAQELCEVVMGEFTIQKEGGAPKDEQEQQRRAREISRIALRNGVLPSALYLHTIMYMSANKHS